MDLILLLLVAPILFVAARLVLSRTAMKLHLRNWGHWVEDRIHVYQTLKVPELNENHQENQFYRKVSAYVKSLPSVEDSDFTNLLSGKKQNDISLALNDDQTVSDAFLGARVSWTNRVVDGEKKEKFFVLRLKKKDKRRVLHAYLQHIFRVSEEIENRAKELRLYYMKESLDKRRWGSIPFHHPSTFETIAMDADLKNKVKSDLESFVKSRQYYHRLGRVWKRSYLLYGPSGTGKSSFIAAMARFLSYDVYELDLNKVADDSDLKSLLLQAKNKSLIVVEDLDRFYENLGSSGLSNSGILNFMDGIMSSCCGDEKIMVFTMSNKDSVDSAMLRPGRIDVHICFPMCNFDSFKVLANNYLGVKEHKLFPQVEEIFQAGATLSPAEIGEIMLVNRGSPSRALRSVITALQINGDAAKSRRRVEVAAAEEGCGKEGNMPVVKELNKLYGLLSMRRSKKIEPSDSDSGLIER